MLLTLTRRFPQAVLKHLTGLAFDINLKSGSLSRIPQSTWRARPISPVQGHEFPLIGHPSGRHTNMRPSLYVMALGLLAFETCTASEYLPLLTLGDQDYYTTIDACSSEHNGFVSLKFNNRSVRVPQIRCKTESDARECYQLQTVVGDMLWYRGCTM
ncbi:uncharacterized protein LOC122259232 [Penaeus japonicus]|uniref:uncharacterized protein LOC122259232 n=1 Tax=Penaeus japonicus TaxID=27405 RepID=UPI001C70C39F|nr:uncharacterized protein LOC122259232 [Penaeus japonicus]